MTSSALLPHAWLAAGMALLLGACATAPHAPRQASFHVVRHAEKVDASRDPDLSEAGRQRAQALARILRDHDLVAIYTTDFVRTRETVAPVAAEHALAPVLYDAKQPAAAFAARLKSAHPRGVVLVAGHSNTVPDIVAALCACDVAPMPDHEYDRLSIVRIDADGHARLTVERYGAPSP